MRRLAAMFLLAIGAAQPAMSQSHTLVIALPYLPPTFNPDGFVPGGPRRAIAERILGMPPDTRPDRDVAFDPLNLDA